MVVARPELCSIDGRKGELVYRDYDIRDPRSTEATKRGRTLIRGELRSTEEPAASRQGLAECRPLSSEAAQVVDLER
jgi:citrate synthase